MIPDFVDEGLIERGDIYRAQNRRYTYLVLWVDRPDVDGRVVQIMALDDDEPTFYIREIVVVEFLTIASFMRNDRDLHEAVKAAMALRAEDGVRCKSIGQNPNMEPGFRVELYKIPFQMGER